MRMIKQNVKKVLKEVYKCGGGRRLAGYVK